MCIDEECLGNAPPSEPEYGASPDGSSRRESPLSSEPKESLILRRLRRGCPLQQLRVDAGFSCVNLGGTASAFVPWDGGEFYFGGIENV